MRMTFITWVLVLVLSPTNLGTVGRADGVEDKGLGHVNTLSLIFIDILIMFMFMFMTELIISRGTSSKWWLEHGSETGINLTCFHGQQRA